MNVLRKPVLFLVTLSLLCASCRCLECLYPRSALPTVRDCEDLTEAIAYLSRLPGENVPKMWGRHLSYVLQ